MAGQVCFEAALEAYDAGLCPVPAAEDGSKRPDGPWKEYQRERPSREEVARIYANGRHGLGLVCGRVSGGLEMFELEARARELWPTFRAACAKAGCGEALERVRMGYLEETPSGGIHLLWRCEEIEGNLKLARRLGAGGEVEVLFETRGEGGFVVVAPSCGPVHSSGKPWVRRYGSFATIARITPEERQAILAVARSFDDMPVIPPPPPPIPTAESFWAPRHESWMDAVVAEFNASHTWADILSPHGWVFHHQRDGITYWSRPGKDPREGHSATTNAKGTDRLIIFSSAVAGFEVYDGAGSATSYDRFGAWVVLNHKGDRVAAARTLRSTQAVPAVEVQAPGDEPHLDWDRFWREEVLGEDWLVEPVVPRGRQVALWATHKTGKSLLALEMAAAIASGRSCLGSEPGPAIRVLYVDMEMIEADLRERLEDMGYGPDSDLSRLFYCLHPSLPPLDTPAGGEVLMKYVEHYRPELLVLDTMSRVVMGEENSADTYRNFFLHTGVRLRALGISVLRIDHGGKDPTLGQRGSSAKGDDVDLVWQLEVTEGGRQLVRRHSRMGWVPERVSLRIREDPWFGHVVSTETEWPAGTKALADVLDGLGLPLSVGRPTARRALSQAGETARNETLVAALKYRRQQANNRPGTA